MMRQVTPVAISLLLVTVAACANVADTAFLSTAQNVTQSREDSIPVYDAGACHFKLPLNGGTVTTHNGSSIQIAGYYPPGTSLWSIPLICHTGATQKDIDIFQGAKEVNGNWIWADSGEKFSPNQHFKNYRLTGKNWSGMAITYDQTTGNESLRQRILQFCLFETNGPQVLCGGPMAVQNINVSASTSKLPKILAVLKTLVFVDTPSTSPASPDTTDKP